MASHPISILVVDDEPDLCELTKEFLGMEEDFLVETVTSVKEAWGSLKERRFDIIVSDYQMPVEDGISFLKSLRGAGNKIPFILFTGRGREEVAIEALNNGADAYLQKGGHPAPQYTELGHRIRSINRRHKAEMALVDSESELRTLFESNPDAVIIIGLDLKIMDCNLAATNLLQLSKSEIIRKGIGELGVFDERTVEQFQDRLRSKSMGDPGRELISEVHRKDGTVKLVEGRATPLVKSGKMHAFQIIAQDITESHLAQLELQSNHEKLLMVNQQLAVAEEELRHQIEVIMASKTRLDEEKGFSGALMDSLPGIFYIYDARTLRLVRYNKNHRTVSGYSDQEMIDKHVLEWHRPENARAVLGAIEMVMKKGHASMEAPLVMKDGREVPYLLTAIRLDQGDRSYFMGVGIDISDRIMAEEELRRKTAMFEAQTTATIDGILVIDADNKRILTNDRIIELFKVPKYIMENDDDSLLLNHVSILTKYPEMFLSKVNYLNEHPLETSRDEIEFKDGMVLDRYSAPVIGKDGRYYGRTWIFRDITDRKASEAALQESEQLYRTLFDKSPFAITLNDRENRFVDVNEKHLQMIEQKREEIIGKTPIELGYVKAEEFNKIQVALRGNNGVLEEYPMDITSPSGQVKNLLISSRIIQYRGASHLLSISHDVTELMEARKALQHKVEELDQERERIQRITDLTPSAVYQLLIHPDGRMQFLFLSQGVESIVHAPTGRFFQKEDWWTELIEPDELNRIVASVNKCVETQTTWELEFRIRDYKGIQRWVHGRASPSYDTKLGKTVWTGTFTDVTDLKRNEVALQSTNRQLDLLNEVTRHDMRNRLMVLSGYIGLLQSTDTPSDRAELIVKMNACIGALQNQIEFTKAYQNIGRSTPQWQNVHEVLGNAVPHLDLGAMTIVEKGTDVSILADPMLENAVKNIIENAVIHGGGATEMDISADVRDGRLVVSFRDNGKGMTDEERAHLFQRGYGRNNGFGLFLSREVLDITGITICECGVPGQGANFQIIVPEGGWRRL